MFMIQKLGDGSLRAPFCRQRIEPPPLLRRPLSRSDLNLSEGKATKLLELLTRWIGAHLAPLDQLTGFETLHSLSQNSSGKRDEFSSVTRVLEDVSSHENNAGVLIKRKRLAVFVSGGGSNFRSIHEASLQQLIRGDVVVLVTNNPDCGGAQYAKDKGIPVVLFPKSKGAPDGFLPADIVAALRTFEVDFILLAGYLKMIPDPLIKAYPRSILNIHPSLLPAFGGKGYYGMKVHKAVIASGARYSGPTIHFVDEHYDTGAILAQRVLPVLANDSAEDLAARILQEEHNLYVEVVAALCEEQVVWRSDGVPLIRSKINPDQFS